MRTIILILFLFMQINLFAQFGKNGDGNNPIYIPETRLFNYNYKPWIAYEWSPLKVIVDTVNLCRLRTNPVRELTVYYLTGTDTSQLKREKRNVFGYDTLGNLIRWDNPSAWFYQNEINFDTLKLDCDSINNIFEDSYKKRANKTIILKFRYAKEYNTYDENGYLTERKTIKKGLFKIDVSPFRPSINQIQKFEYSNNYKIVKYSECYENRARFDNCTFDNFYILILDENNNIFKELYFNKTENGNVFLFGREFVHEYY